VRGHGDDGRASLTPSEEGGGVVGSHRAREEVEGRELSLRTRPC
jgi:hypothetical protein